MLKPMHSAFFQTPLDILLRYLGAILPDPCPASRPTAASSARRTTRTCATFQIIVPPDCSAARTRREHEQAIEHIGEMADAKVVVSSSFRLEKAHG